MKSALAAKRKLLWVSNLPAPPNVRMAVEQEWDLRSLTPDGLLDRHVAFAPIAIVCPDGGSAAAPHWGEFLDRLHATSTIAVFLLPPESDDTWPAILRRAGEFICVSQDAPAEELAATLAAAEALRPALQSLREELSTARELATSAAKTVQEVDEEMRLAARLQRDFLPSRLPEVGPVRFGVLFHPAGWVSGDIYDVMRLDETHVGFYIVDAVGHGMPAALLTMFIKKALQTKRIDGNSYQIVPPHVSIAELNRDIYEQGLSSCQFCTAAYCVMDTETLVLTYCRAGHPRPIVFRADGRSETLAAPGSLLGVLAEESYQSREARLSRGDRVVLFTDGAEDALCGVDNPNRPLFADVIAPFARMGREEMLLKLKTAIDDLPRSAKLRDDITIMVMDVDQ